MNFSFAWHSRILLLIFATSILVVRANTQETPADTTLVDTTISTRQEVPREPIIPIEHVGSIDSRLPSNNVVTDSIMRFSDYRHLGDLLHQLPGRFIADLGSPGQMYLFLPSGLGNRNMLFLNDGILLNEPYTGLYNVNLYPVEYANRIETVTGVDAFLYGFNSTAAAINMVSESRRAIRPYTQIRYSESSYGYSLVDGAFSQDIIRGLNISAGAQRTLSDGRFANSDYDYWNGRFKLRYNISNSVNIFLTEIYNQTELGLNGGIDLSATPESLRFERIRAVVRNSDSYEKITRHDVQLGIATQLPGDPNATSSFTFFYSTNLREYRDEENRPDPNGIFLQQDQRSRWFGARFGHRRTIGLHLLDLGAEVQRQGVLVTPATGETQRTLASVSGLTEMRFENLLRTNLLGRLESVGKSQRLSFGVSANYTIVDGLQAFGGFSLAHRFPTIQELDGTDPVIVSALNGDPEQHTLVEGGLRWTHHDHSWIELRAFRREIDDMIVIRPSSFDTPTPYTFTRAGSQTVQGLTATGTIRVGSFVLEGNVQTLDRTPANADPIALPTWTSTGALYFWDDLIRRNLVLKTGVRGRYQNAFVGREFNQQAYIFLPSSAGTPLGPNGTIDFVIIAHLGDAYVHFIWDNILNRQYAVTNFYPVSDRALRFGITWAFLD